MNDPCPNTTVHWSHIWIYWILRKYGFPKDIVHVILQTYLLLYYTTAIDNQFMCTRNSPLIINRFKSARKHYRDNIPVCYFCNMSQKTDQ
jgi:hypothetical protein